MLDPNIFLSGLQSPLSPKGRSPFSSIPSTPGVTRPPSPSLENTSVGEQQLMELQLLAFAEHGIGSELEEL